MRNILASTTRQWNPGDELILHGVQKILAPRVGDANWMIMDRNPDILLQAQCRGNSWRGEALPQGKFHLAVFAGTPEWFGWAVGLMTREILERNIPCLYLGVGASGVPIPFTADDRECLKRARLVVCRDPNAASELLKLNVPSTTLPCPGIFSATKPVLRKSSAVVKVGVVFQVHQTPYQDIEPELLAEVSELIDTLSKKYQVELVCHYKDEYLHALRNPEWEKLPVRYSWEARDYPNIYHRYDAVVSTRVHGAVVAASCGVPALMVRYNNFRASGICWMFPEMRVKVSEVAARLEAMNPMQESERLVSLRYDTWNRYQAALNEVSPWP